MAVTLPWRKNTQNTTLTKTGITLHLFQVEPVICTHHSTCHSMNQSLVRQEADSRATVPGHVCGGARSPASRKAGEQTQGGQLQLGVRPRCGSVYANDMSISSYGAFNKRSEERKKLINDNNKLQNDYKVSIHWLNSDAGCTSSSSLTITCHLSSSSSFFQLGSGSLLTRRMRHQTELSILYQQYTWKVWDNIYCI